MKAKDKEIQDMKDEYSNVSGELAREKRKKSEADKALTQEKIKHKNEQTQLQLENSSRLAQRYMKLVWFTILYCIRVT